MSHGENANDSGEETECMRNPTLSCQSCLDPVHTRPAKLENGGFTLKTHKMLSVHTTPAKLENATITGHLGFVFEENSSEKSYDYRDAIGLKSVLEKPRFRDCW